MDILYYYLILAVAICNGHKSRSNRTVSRCTSPEYILESELTKFRKCYTETTYKLTSAIIRNVTGLEPVFDELCNQSVREKCVKDLREAIEVCALTQAERIVRRDAIKALNAFNRYVCDNDAENLRDYSDDAHGRACVGANDRLQKIYKCNKNYLELPYMEYVWIRLIYRFNSDCVKQAEQTNCIYNVLNACDNKIARDFYLNLHMSVLNSTRCGQLAASLYPILVGDTSASNVITFNSILILINLNLI